MGFQARVREVVWLVAFAVTAVALGDDAGGISPCKSVDGRLDCTLRVEDTTVRLAFKGISFRARTYNGTIPGPALRARPGDQVRILLQNRLGENLPGSGCSDTMNKPHAANSTNLHIHGIYDSAADDNTFKCVEPGHDYLYRATVRPDVGTSTLWYHPHLHGSSSVQMYGGMAGMFEIVDDVQDAAFFEFADTRSLVLQMLDLDPASKDYIETFMSMGGKNTMPLELHNPENFVGRLLLTNGEVGPSIPLDSAGVQLRLKLVNAMSGSNNLVNIGFLGEAVNVCDLHVLAYDGVYIASPRLQRSVLLPSGGRADIAVTCRTAGTHLLGTVLEGVEQFGGIFSKDTHVMVAVVVDKPSETSIFPGMITSKLPGPPPFYPDLSMVNACQHVEPQSLMCLQPTGKHTIMLGDAAGDNNVDGWPYNGSVSHSVDVGSIQEWRLIGGEGQGLEKAHPYHQHVSHFQITSVSLPELGPLIARVGDYRDTVPIYAALNYTVRFVVPAFLGPMMVHCHITKHADAGMMTIINITERKKASPLATATLAGESQHRGRLFAGLGIVLAFLGISLLLFLLGGLAQFFRGNQCPCAGAYKELP